MKKKRVHVFIKGFIGDKHRKNIFLILKDLIELKKKNSFKSLNDFRYYFNSLMYKKDAGNLDMYVSDKTRIRFNDHTFYPINHSIDNKIIFSELMTKLQLPVPLFLGKIEKGILFDMEGNRTILNNNDDLLPMLKELVKNNTVFIKSAYGRGGRGIFKFDKNSLLDLSGLDFKEDYLIEKGLIQHDDLNEINPYCINTLRIVTVNRNNEIKIPNSLFRMGVGKSHIDNVSSGGIFINYDIVENKLEDFAKKFADKGGTSYDKHPDSNYVFKNKALPYPTEVIDLVIKAAKVIPEKDIIGWDIAYTPEGPVIIEANANGGTLVTQITLKGLLNNEVYKGLLKPVL